MKLSPTFIDRHAKKTRTGEPGSPRSGSRAVELKYQLEPPGQIAARAGVSRHALRILGTKRGLVASVATGDADMDLMALRIASDAAATAASNAASFVS